MGTFGALSDEEEGEIVEDEQTKLEAKAAVAGLAPLGTAAPPADNPPSTKSNPPDNRSNDHKRAAPETPSHGGDTKRRRVDSNKPPSADAADKNTHDTLSMAERKAQLSILLREPFQVRTSRVLLNFNCWFDSVLRYTWVPRISADDLQSILLHFTDPVQYSNSKYLEDWDDECRPAKLCFVLAKGFHPDVLSKAMTAKDSPLTFFTSCSSMPLALSTTAAMESNAKIKEMPLPRLLSRFPSPLIDLEMLGSDDLFGAKVELTMLAIFTTDPPPPSTLSATATPPSKGGWTDELLFHPAGTFFRKTTNQTGDWRLDGDLLHLSWKVAQSSEKDNANVTAIDVLQADDDSLRRFRTSDHLDATYAPTAPAAKPRPKRQLRLTLLRAAAIGPSVSASTRFPKLPTDNDRPDSLPPVSYYLLSYADRLAHQYPVDIAAEQSALAKKTNGQSTDVFVTTTDLPSLPEPNVLAVDCEMCETVLGSELTRVTLVNADGAVVYDQLVKPRHTIVNYHTAFSGITAEMLDAVDVTLADVQQSLLGTLLYANTVLVGHSIDSDLRALRIVHPHLIDTALLYPHPRGFPFKPSLKMLAATFLNQSIQSADMAGHDSCQDAVAALELFQMKVANGPTFGFPPTPPESAAYMTLVDKCHQSRLGVYTARPSADKESEVKPWSLFSSGEWADLVASTHLHNQPRDDGTTKVDQGGSNAPSNCFVAPVVASLVQVADQLQTHGASQDVMWIEVDAARTDPAVYMATPHVWKQDQHAQIVALNDDLTAVHAALPPNTLQIVAALNLFRHLRGVRLKTKWGDGWDSQWTDRDLKSLQYALSGALDSVVFLKHKKP
ncbi:hypothetical protein DYB32_006522 [Aphanomyces invadans]|uniref:Exonuclease domain-containing protein n=1 Tax=Aphanomyces invadans TaxID=157072 RepID=A0A418ARU4_9STRA|nr:hypothetical protein DYB32_006522 [Aphanomyces invadans]